MIDWIEPDPLFIKLGAWNRWQTALRELRWETRKDHKAILERVTSMAYRDYLIAEAVYAREVKL